MKIDLHCHTKKVKKSDGINRNVDVATFSNYMKDLDIKIVAITNHNLFDKKQYEEFKESVKDYTMVWPGIELDIDQQPEKNGHMIVIEYHNKIRLQIRCIVQRLICHTSGQRTIADHRDNGIIFMF